LNVDINRKLTKVTETAEFVRNKLNAETNPLLLQRLQTLYLIASRQVKSRSEIARILGVNRNSVSTWLIKYEQSGLNELLQLKKASGQPPKMTVAAKAALAEKLTDEKGFGSYSEIRAYLLAEHQVELSYSRVHTIVRYEMKARAESRAPEQSE